jgi:hypothetical protein
MSIIGNIVNGDDPVTQAMLKFVGKHRGSDTTKLPKLRDERNEPCDLAVCWRIPCPHLPQPVSVSA